jgi:flagellar biosynthesis anti-sigma factor FlgM
MKIGLEGQTAVQGPTERSAKQVTTTSAADSLSATGDRTTFHSESVQSLVGQAMATEPVRQDNVDALRQSIGNGTYEIHPAKIASALIAAGGK